MEHHLLKNFYVIAVVSNPVRFRSRPELFKKFADHMRDAGVKLVIVEAAFGDRMHELTEADNPLHIRLRTSDELWHKENMINIGISRLPKDWEYVAWVDADISFVRKDWALETVQQLQHFAVVQMWASAIDLDPNMEPMAVYQSFGSCYAKNKNMSITYEPYAIYGHPGFAWAARRDAIEQLGGLIDKAICGHADHHMAWALVGKGDQTYPGNIHPNYKHMILSWQDRAVTYLYKNIGHVPGTIFHHWHGKKKDRRYVERWDILTRYNFDPYTDIKRDSQGLYQLDDRNSCFRDALRLYFRQRNEDSVDND